MTLNHAPLHPACLSVDALMKACDVRRERASGPGGQHRNKVETAIVVTHQPTGLKGSASERRSQAQNQVMAVKRLRVTLAIHFRGDGQCRCDDAGRLLGEMAERWYARVKSKKLLLNHDHDDFPAILAWVMDILWAQQLDVPGVANLLGISGTQVLKLLKAEPAAFTAFNQARQAKGMHVMK